MEEKEKIEGKDDRIKIKENKKERKELYKKINKWKVKKKKKKENITNETGNNPNQKIKVRKEVNI